MSSGLRWLILAVCVLLMLVLIGYARGARQRNEPVPVASGVTLALDGPWLHEA
jgi:hypothetical protein